MLGCLLGRLLEAGRARGRAWLKGLGWLRLLETLRRAWLKRRRALWWMLRRRLEAGRARGSWLERGRWRLEAGRQLGRLIECRDTLRRAWLEARGALRRRLEGWRGLGWGWVCRLAVLVERDLAEGLPDLGVKRTSHDRCKRVRVNDG